MSSKRSIHDSFNITGENQPDNIHFSDEHQAIVDLPLPNQKPFLLSFHNLSHTLKISHKMTPSCPNNTDHEIRTKLILDNVSGQAREGEILAVLGASGAGKSTLIDALAGRIKKQSLQGTVTLNGQALESRLLKVISAYVMQDDLLFPMLTVEETLMFSAEFRLPRSVSKEMKQARVEALIDQLGLRNVANTVIGDEGHRGVSGGERRRVSIGVDIVHDPILLFLDEPTSGLDSSSALMVTQVLQRIAKNGSIVMLSIHQPSYRILQLLNHLILLSNGKTVYSGKSTNLLQFFNEFGHPVPENENPTDFALDLIRQLEKIPTEIANLAEFNKSWSHHHHHSNITPEQNTSLDNTIKPKSSVPATASSAPIFANPFWKETGVITKRLFINSTRSPLRYGTRFFATLAVSLILSSIFWHLDASPEGSRKRTMFLALFIASIYFNCVEEIPVFIQERYIFIRETAYNTYRHSSYVLAHSLFSLPWLLLLSLTSSTTTFWSVGLAGGSSGFFYYFITIFGSYFAATSFMSFISALMSNSLLALTTASAVLVFFTIFSGFFPTRDQIPHYWIWFHYISLIKYPYEGVLQSEFGSDPNKCFNRGTQLFNGSPLNHLSEPKKAKALEGISMLLGMNISSSSCFMDGRHVLKANAATDVGKWNCLWIVFACGLIYRVSFYLALLFGSKNKRR